MSKTMAAPAGESGRHIGLPAKILYTAFVVTMVPYYWRTYGPRNFLYFCDVALMVTLVGLWLESSLLISMEAVAILLPQTIWIVDFVGHLLGLRLLGMTDYMFDPKYPLLVRGLSTFHGWLPILLIWLLWRLGYDRRAFAVQAVCGIALLLICYFGFVPPTAAAHGWRAANINYVYGLDENQAQMKLPPLAWFGMLTVTIPVVLYLPTHLVLSKVFAKPRK